MRFQILDRALLVEVDQRLDVGVRKAGKKLVCRRGCTSCCIGVFTINLLDAWRLREGLEQLQKSDPARAGAVRRRAENGLRSVEERFPGDRTIGLLDDDEDKVDGLTAKFSDQPCPALDPATGLCDLYAHRPMTCRTFGLPILQGTEKLPPCSLCFRGASRDEIEDCRVEPDPDDLENAILCELPDAEADGGPETIVAYALVRDLRLASDDRTDESRAAR